MLGFVLDVIFTVAALRALWKLLQGITVGMKVGTVDSETARRGPAKGVHMEKDPVCGTYVIPNRALSMSIGRDTVYFCSAACRDKYRAKTA